MCVLVCVKFFFNVSAENNNNTTLFFILHSPYSTCIIQSYLSQSFFLEGASELQPELYKHFHFQHASPLPIFPFPKSTNAHIPLSLMHVSVCKLFRHLHSESCLATLKAYLRSRISQWLSWMSRLHSKPWYVKGDHLKALLFCFVREECFTLGSQVISWCCSHWVMKMHGWTLILVPWRQLSPPGWLSNVKSLWWCSVRHLFLYPLLLLSSALGSNPFSVTSD